jgi:uncharacterized membrane protein YfcA
MAAGVLLGSFFGAYVANSLPKETLKLVFGFLLIYVASYTVFGKEHLGRTTVLSGVLVVIAMGVFAATRWYDRSQATASAPTASIETRTPGAETPGVRSI